MKHLPLSDAAEWVPQPRPLAIKPLSLLLAFSLAMAPIALSGCRAKTTDTKATDAKATDTGAKPAAGDAAAEGDDAKAAPVAVELATATLRAVETTVEAQGLLAPAPDAIARVAVPTAARLTQVLVREGDRVRAGQILAVTDNRTARAATQSASAALSSAGADARSAQIAARAAQSDEANAVRQAALALQTALSEDRAAVANAQNALQSAQSAARRARFAARAPDAQNALRAARLAFQSARLDRDATVAGSQNALRTAQTELSRIRAGARAPEIASARAALTQAQATQARAQTEVERVQFLVGRGIRAQRDLDDAQTALTVAQTGVQSAQDALNLLLAGARAQEIQAAALAVQGAQQTLDAARRSGAARVASAQNEVQTAIGNARLASSSRPEDVRTAVLAVQAAQSALVQARQSGQARIASARASLDAARAGALQIAARQEDARAKAAAVAGKVADLQSARVAESSAQIRAPLSGIVTQRMLGAGDMADPATPILEISDASALVLEAQLPSERAAAIRAGMPARLQSESAPNRTFSGAVQSVGQVDPQSGLLEVRILVSNPGGALKIGSLASCAITLSRRPLAVTVPKRAVLTREGESIVMVAQGEVAHQKTVKTGASSGDFIEVQSGVKAGVRVVTLGQYELEDGAAIKIAAPGG